MDIENLLLKSYEDTPRENKTVKETQSIPEEKATPDVEKLLLESYENIPRENRIFEEVNNTPEEEAVQDIEKMVELLKKKIKGRLSEQEQRNLEENAEKWKKDIEVLRNYIQQETDKR